MKTTFTIGLFLLGLSILMSVRATSGIHLGFYYATAEIAVVMFVGLTLMLPYAMQLIADVFRRSYRILSNWLPEKRS